ncbi:hypothetical protein Clacol_004681 [Clathrus columnatus]|uniref:Uncharacterized protein n=1 Tax=Clathrus columnatus TaxID=1419009 RepID=A0AAV5A857_9AGAM|nr:hypothetical protein Clacol_004681 [Clathrus columnatus]
MENLPFIGIQGILFPFPYTSVVLILKPPCKKLQILPTCFERIVTIAYAPILFLVENITIILSDVLAFLAVIHQVWGLWKEKRRLRLQAGKDLVTLLLQQGILRFSFVLFITVTQVIVQYIGSDIILFQNVLSTILICEFTLGLRRRNTTARSLPTQSALELPDLNLSSQDNPARSMQSVLGRFQKRIIAEMGERSDPVGIDASDSPGQLEGEPDPETT